MIFNSINLELFTYDELKFLLVLCSFSFVLFLSITLIDLVDYLRGSRKKK